MTNAELTRKVNQLSDDWSFMYDHVESIAKTQRKHTRQLKVITGRLDGIDNRLDGIDNRLDGIDNRLDGITQVLGEVVRRLPAPETD